MMVSEGTTVGATGMITALRVADSQPEALWTALTYQVTEAAGAVSPDITPESTPDSPKKFPPEEAEYTL